MGGTVTGTLVPDAGGVTVVVLTEISFRRRVPEAV
jgi:hypothetical protein